MTKKIAFVVAVVLLVSSAAVCLDGGRTERFSFPFSLTEFSVGNCGTFDVLSDSNLLVSGTTVYDKLGNPVQTVQHVRGEGIYYNSVDPNKKVSGGPGEGEVDHFDWEAGTQAISALPFKVRIPGYGLIFAETGHFVVDMNSGQVLFNSGHNQFVDQDLAALCEYLK